MTLSRRFPHALATAAALLVCASSSANAAQNPSWSDGVSVPTSSSEIFEPKVATADGRTVAIWRENDGTNTRLTGAIQATPGGSWSTPTYLSTDGVDIEVREYQPAVDASGNVAILWQNADGGNTLWSRTLPAGGDSWGPALLVADGEGVGGASINARADGVFVVSYTSYHGQDTIRTRTLTPGAGSWSAPVDIDQTGNNPGSLGLAFNASGDALAVWTVAVSGDTQLRAARYDRESDTWGAPANITEPSPETIQGHAPALSPAGAATVLFVHNSDAALRTASVAAGSDDWDLGPVLTADGYVAVTASLASDRDGDMVAAFQSIVQADMAGTSRALVRTRDADTGQWSEAQSLTGEDFSGGAVLTVDRDYNMLVAMLSSPGLPAINVGAAYRPDGADAFYDDTILHPFAFEFSHGLPMPRLDAQGNAFVSFPLHGDSDVGFGLVVGDATGPDLGTVSIPGSGKVGESLSFSVAPTDLLSDVDGTSWSFGDGGSASGNAATHTYTAAGTYTVTVSSRDLNGIETSTTRTITIDAPPAPEVDEPDDTPVVTPKPKVLAPVIEARLSGKTITLTAKVSLRSGKSCSGKASATTSFGNTTYRTTLKLKKVGKTCVGTGTIKLKKSPSTRTKLRVTVSAKTIKTRTLTTKRA